MNAMTSPSRLWRATYVAWAGAAMLVLVACDQNSGKTAGQQLDAALAKTGQAAETAAAKTGEMAATAKAKIESSNIAEEAKAAAKGMGADLSRATANATITTTIKGQLAKDPALSALAIDVDTRDGVVTLNGNAPNTAAKLRAESIAKAVAGVTAVDNRLQIRG